jgi:DNA/RNA-binding domain of Phe-tRNA-synthetase-like protein
MTNVKISRELSDKVPLLTLSCIECSVITEEKNDELWELINNRIAGIANSLHTEDISKMAAIASSRRAYRACGKDPARYRLSAEALLRRVVKQKEIFQINNVVDLLNLVSISTGYSIGGYDADKISGDVIFNLGRADEKYDAIGRGEMNIWNLPVFRDSIGPFGSPTSDSVRTSVTNETKRFLMIIIDFGFKEGLKEAAGMAVSLLEKYAGAGDFKIKEIVYDSADM